MASALCWVWGLIFLLVSFLIFLDDRHAGRPSSYIIPRAIVEFLIGGAYCFAGYALAKRRTSGAVTAVLISAFVTVLAVTPIEPTGLAIAILNITIIALVFLSWRHVGKPRSNEVGA